jgi:redox-sensitive bicupin YhaK (pirin superfamily)
MEITTILISGSQAHKDNTGSEGIINENSVQTMSAGTGIIHSEFNASQTESFHSYQIWVYPKLQNVKPRHEKFSYKAEDKLNKILLTLSPDGRNNTAIINQDAFFSVSNIEKNFSVHYNMNLNGNGVYIHCAKGKVEIEGNILMPGDAIGIYETEKIHINCHENSELVFVEVPMERGIQL